MKEARHNSSLASSHSAQLSAPAITKDSSKLRLRAWHWLRLALVLAACLPGAAVFTPSSLASAVKRVFGSTPLTGAYTGTVYLDYNANGAMDTSGTAPNYAIDTGMAGVVVTAYNASGVAVGSATTSASGAYSLTPSGSGPYRLEFTSLPSGYYPSAVGANNGTTVRFVADGGASNIDLGILRPADYSQNNPFLATNCYINGNNAGTDDVLVALNYSGSGTVQHISTANQLGATWGLAWRPATKTLFAAAALKRHSGFGPGKDGTRGNADDISAIYVVDYSSPGSNGAGTVVTSQTIDLSLLGVNVGANPRVGASPANDLGAATAPNHDYDTFDKVGRRGLGGIALSEDGNTLYAVNLNSAQPQLVSLNVANLNSVTLNSTVNIPNPGCPGSDTAAPWAVRVYNGQVYVGTTCTADVSQNAANLRAYVLRLNGSSFTTIDIDSTSANSFIQLYYDRAVVYYATSSGRYERAEWNPWASSFSSFFSNTAVNLDTWYPQPILTDLEFDASGNLVLGLMDRAGHQTGWKNYGPTSSDTNLWQGITGGEVLKVCNVSGSFVPEGQSGCARSHVNNADTPDGSDTAPGAAGIPVEFYDDDGDATTQSDGHTEIANGGLALLPGANELVITAQNPDPDVARYNSGGWRWLNQLTGARLRNFVLYVSSGTPDATFGKANGLGDNVLLRDPAPLQLGNRVWNDANANGVQDPGENGIQNVTVQLWTGSTQVGTASTDSNGNYYFGGAANTNMLSSATVCTGTVDVRVNASSDDAEQRLNTNAVNLTSVDLELLYDDGVPSSQLVGTRFNSLSIPRAATITSAYIEFTALSSGTVSSGSPSITIRGQASGTPGTFTATTNDLSSRATTTASASWSPGAVTNGATFQTASLSSVVQELVNRSDWESGNSMAIIFSGDLTTAFRRAASYDGSSSTAPRLVINYNCPYPINPNTAYEIRIPNAAGGSKQAALGALNLVTANTDPSTNGDARDADATLSSTTAVISLTTGGYGENNHTYDFGFSSATTTYSVGNRVWYDTDNDGVLDGTEVGVNNVTVDLLNSGNTQIATTTTDSSGYYRFDNVAEGTGYRVRIRGSNFTSGGALYGYQNSTGNTSATDQRDNGVDPASNNPSTAGVLSSTFNLGAALQPTGEPDFTGSGNGAHGPNGDVNDNLTVDFGFYCIAIGNLVFLDNNSNGTFDGGDVGLAGAGLALFQSDGTTLVRAGLDGVLGTPDDVSGNDGTVNTNYIQSNGSGGYQFKGLPPGSYVVRIYPPYGYKSSNDIASSGNPNNGTDNDDNGVGNTAGSVASAALTVTAGSGSGTVVTNSTGLTTNPTLDFGLVTFSPTAVRLTELTARARGGAPSNDNPAGRGRSAGSVTIDWRTGFEADCLGFNVYRDESGQRVKLNPSLIAGSALLAGTQTLLTAGNTYTWTDAKGQPGMNYWLEELDLSGKSTWYGPVHALSSFPGETPFAAETNQRSPLLAELTAAPPSSGVSLREWADEETSERAADATPLRLMSAATASAWTLPGQSAAKLSVRRSGWYRVTPAELAGVGFNTNVNPASLQLFTDGAEVPIKVTSKSTLGFESLEFYGRGLDTQATDTRCYWLVAGNPSGRRWESAPAKQPERATVNSFRSTVERKERLLYFSALLNGEAENWFGALIRAGEPTLQKLTTRYVERKTSEPATLEIVLQGVTEQAHVINIELNARYVGTLNFSHRQRLSKQFNVSPEWLREGENEIKFTAAGGNSDHSLIDWLRLSYARSYRAENDTLSFSLAAGQSAFIAGFSAPNIRVLQLGNNSSVVRELTVKAQLVTDSLGRSYGFSLQGEGGAYLALADQRLERVAGIALNQPSDWRAEKNAADFLIITHSAFKALANKLAQVRRTQGWQVAVVDADDAYDEFSFGTHTPQAIKDLLAHARRYWQRKPSHALFFGAGTYDPRDYQGTGLIDFIPVKLGETARLETAIENWFADTNSDGWPDLALGRLPARNLTQAETIINKLINFKPDAQLRSALLVSDRTTDGYDFRAGSEQLSRELPALMFKQFINRNDGSAEQVRGQIIQSINQNPLVVNWHGHGSVDVWTGDGLLRARDATALTNRLPSLFVMTTCLNGYFIGTPQASLSDALLLNTAGGAFAVVSSSALTTPVPQLTFNRQFYRSLFGGARTLGEALNAAKDATPDRDVRNSFVLLGDPTLRLTQVRSGPKR